MSEINLKSTKLFDELSKEEREVLFDENNTKKVKEFCKTLIASKSEKADSLPTEMTIGDRTYEILGFLKEGEKSIVGHEMIKRVKEMNAHLGQDDGQYLLDHQQDIPESLRGKVYFAFTDWRHPDNSGRISSVCWYGGRWIRDWYWLDDGYWYGRDRVLRRK